ncbi:glycosyltransferase family 4 protein [Liberiplasma polymorphum]|uniref:glycosyltransferase family 4 protein n=1 Tax=Liberiplasma polymorphum TaxID=3374570 RepID=UPI0037712971
MENKSLNVWLLHHYAVTPKYNGLFRPYMFAKELKSNNIIISTIASSYLHFSDTNLIKNNTKFIVETDQHSNFVYLKTVNGNKGFRRLLNMFSYYFRLLSLKNHLINEIGYPDVIVASSPHLLTLLAGMKLSRKMSVPLISEIRDFWPEVIFQSGKLSERSLLGKFLLSIEKKIYYYSSALIFLKEGDCQYIIDRQWHRGKKAILLDKTVYINNGINLTDFDEKIDTKIVLKDPDLSSNKFKIVYTGALRKINDIDFILDAAKLLTKEKVLFLIYGEGTERERLQQRIIRENIDNVRIKGYVNRSLIPSILSNSNINLLNYSDNLYDWSRGNSSNKLFEYLASRKPVISTVKMGYSIIEKYSCGLEIESHEPMKLAHAIISIMKLSTKEYTLMSNNARQAAEEYDYNVLSRKFEETIRNVANEKT